MPRVRFSAHDAPITNETCPNRDRDSLAQFGTRKPLAQSALRNPQVDMGWRSPLVDHRTHDPQPVPGMKHPLVRAWSAVTPLIQARIQMPDRPGDGWQQGGL